MKGHNNSKKKEKKKRKKRKEKEERKEKEKIFGVALTRLSFTLYYSRRKFKLLMRRKFESSYLN